MTATMALPVITASGTKVAERTEVLALAKRLTPGAVMALIAHIEQLPPDSEMPTVEIFSLEQLLTGRHLRQARRKLEALCK